MIIIAHLNLKAKDIIAQARAPAVATRAACKQAQAMVSTHVAINVPILINLIQQKKKISCGCKFNAMSWGWSPKKTKIEVKFHSQEQISIVPSQSTSFNSIQFN